MASRSASLRTKIVALLVSLAALWAFAAWVTLRDGFNVLGAQTLDSQVAQPSESLLTELQRERRMSVAYLGRRDQGLAQELQAQHERSEKSATTFAESARSWRARFASSDELIGRIDEMVARLDGLGEMRAAVVSGSVDRAGAAAAYTGVLDSLFRVYAAMGQLDDEQIAQDTVNLTRLVRVRELMSQEDALFAGMAAAGRVSAPEYTQFAHLVGAQRFLVAEALAELPDADRERYVQMTEGQAFTRLRALEDRMVTAGRPNAPLPVEAGDWQAAIDPSLKEQEAVVLAGGDALVKRATPVAVWVVIRLVLAAGLGLLAVIASVVVSITTARALLRQLGRLREAAWQLADERLPRVVDRLGRGEEVDVATEAPPLEFGTDEIGQVGKAFNAVQETALRTAVEQADLRRNVREVFLSLARRTQALVHRQLTLLDAMERREHDAEELEDLFRVDHLATRMRRNAENLIVLSGSTPGRAWRRNVPMVDVVRGAVAEVEDYTRVNVLPLGEVSLAGRAVGDVIHLLAELIENGLSFSPPHTTVEVRGQSVANGFAIEIEDRGLGMSEEDLAAANHRIVDQSELNLANASRLGLYVVSRLTERHGVRVRLKESAYGGTTAVVLIPLELVTEDGPNPEDSGSMRTGSAAPTPSTNSADTGRSTALAPVALAATPATASDVPEAVVPAAPTSDGADPATSADEGDTALPTRQRTTATPELPVRARRGPTVPALEAPTVPTGLPAVDRTRGAERVEAPVTADDGPPVATGGDAPTPDQAEAARTDSGLPVRVRQANIVPELRDDPAESESDDEDVVRQPEQVRRMMSSYQTGTRRGRTDAARLLGGPSGAPTTATPEPSDEDPQAP
ncbi:nitrate- and nitrite sensing domain-containing protein [Micromonospora sp. WMMD1155]|uniref:sensor histidine kinase n=1 Tax=Micromonospora sp. WMMD1155 TaxID=3016094 RepID=UPI00249AAAAA|nr:nitrate- and nitrite sensing domain-containing protein [Micromonospora sp. WMMD1155]WFE52833.1 nitrate- and nitrite sensing domain-containing protein [Micromonospora sp. WMMD1155]